MASTPTKLMTFAEFEQLPDPEGGWYELINGELVFVPPAKHRHFMTLQRLRELLQSAAPNVGKGAGKAYTEAPLKPTPDLNWFQVDVAYATVERWSEPDPNGYFLGSPELVIEVLSPSNRPAHIAPKRKICLQTGAREFWGVDIDKRTVEAGTPDGRSITYKSAEQIPLFFSPGSTIAVDRIFA